VAILQSPGKTLEGSNKDDEGIVAPADVQPRLQPDGHIDECFSALGQALKIGYRDRLPPPEKIR